MAVEGQVVGRAADLTRVRAVLDAALAEHPGTVTILGEAGVGKTTLLRTARSLAAERGFATVTGNCAESASGTSHGPIRTALRLLAWGYDQQTLSTAIDGCPVVGTLLPPSLRRAIAVEPPPSPDPDELDDAVLQLITALAAERPLFVALEDLHWADHSTLGLVSFIVRNLTAERVAVFVTARDEDVRPGSIAERTVSELGRLQTTTVLHLEGLDIAGLRDLVAAVGRHVDPAEVERLHQRTGGNPFFALELIAAGGASGSQLPRSVSDVLEVRLNALDPPDLELVRVAAVLGDIDVPVLCATTARDEQDVEGSIHRAIDAGVLAPDSSSGAVTFRHALVREVAYNGLLATERRRWHEAVAHTLDGRAGTDAATLARHYDAANRPADALRTSIAAARTEAGAYGSLEAIVHYRRAAELWNVVPPAGLPDEPTIAELLREAMLCALDAGMFDDGTRFGTRLLDVQQPATDPEQWALDAARVAELQWETGDRTGASDLLERAERYLDGRDDSVARVRVLERLAFHAITSGQNAEGLAVAEQALAAARRTGDAEAVAIALNRIAIASASLGERNGRELLHQAFEEAWRSRLPLETARAGINMLLLLQAGCRLQEAVDAGKCVLRAADELGVGASQRTALVALYARGLTNIGECDRAGDLLAGLHLPNAPRLRTYVALAIAEHASVRGDTERARRALGEGSFELIFVLALWRGCLEAELALIDGEPHVARAVADEYLPMAEFILDATFTRLTAIAIAALGSDECVVADDYLAAAERRAELLDRLPVGPPVDQPAWLASARAACATLNGVPSSREWEIAADAFKTARLVVRSAWAEYRAAAALVDEADDRTEAALLAARAHAVALRTGAEPLRRAIESLVRRARLDVPGIERLSGSDVGLTSRELEVLTLVAAGRTNRDIANELYISVKTASVHVSNILRKIGAANRGEAAAVAHREGLVTPDV